MNEENDTGKTHRFSPGLAVALDVTTLAEAEEIVTQLPADEVIFKVGNSSSWPRGPRRWP